MSSKTLSFARRCALVSIALLSAISSFAQSESVPSEADREEFQKRRFASLFRPFRTDLATLSPDGKYLAYTVRENGAVSVAVVALDNPSAVTTRVVVVTDDSATAVMEQNTREKTPGAVRWMRWVNPTRLVVETNRIFAQRGDESWVNTPGEIVAFEADGSDARSLVTPRDVQLVTGSSADEALKQMREANGTVRPSFRIDEPTPGPTNSTEDAIVPPEDPNEINSPSFTHSPRAPRVFDFHPTKSDCLIIQAGDNTRLDLFELDTITGKLVVLSTEVGASEMITFQDRQGKPRVAVPNTLVRSFPHRYAIDRGGFLRWTDLDKIVAQKTAATFDLSPENFFGERSFPIGFDENPNILYYASNAGRDTYGLYGLDIKSGQRTAIALENPGLDLVEPSPEGFGTNPLVFDRFSRVFLGFRYDRRMRTTAWIHPDWQTLQTNLEKALPGRIVEIQEWDKGSKRFLVLARAPADAGAFYIFEPATGKLSEFVRRAPWLDQSSSHLTVDFALQGSDATSLTGLITLPKSVRMQPIPIVVVCAPEPWQRAKAEFRSEIHALAEMGFAIVQLNPRGTWGFGRKHREAVLKSPNGFEALQVDDIISAIDGLAKKFPLNPKRVALLGERRGGYLAIRALQLRPDRFRCTVSLDGTVDLAAWLAENRWTEGLAGPALTRAFYGNRKNFNVSPLKDETEKITKPVLFLSYPGPDGGPRTFAYLAARNLHSAIKRRDVPTRFFDLPQDYVRRLPQARSEAFAQIEDFLNEHIYSYNVKLGETEVTDDDVKPQKPQK